MRMLCYKKVKFMSYYKIKSLIEKFPQVNLVSGSETPIDFLENLSRELGTEIYVKRDDLTGVAIGGNKVRKLEFLLGDALSKGCDTIITTGAIHSNHALETAGAAKKLGLDVVLVLRGEKTAIPKGNYLLDKLVGADVRIVNVSTGKETIPIMEKIAQELEVNGKKPYIIPTGGATPIGTLGYIKCVLEIVKQEKELGVSFDYIVHATSSGGTQAGLALGFHLIKPTTEVLGIGVGDPRTEVIESVWELINSTAKLLKIEHSLTKEYLENHTIPGYGFGGYGKITKEVVDTIKYVGSLEGLILDPIYTGKAMYGTVDLLKKNIIPKGSTILFIHTGGMTSIFQYDDVIRKFL